MDGHASTNGNRFTTPRATGTPTSTPWQAAKKRISAACSLSLVSPEGREVKESSHLLHRVRNANCFQADKKSFFRTLLGPQIKAAADVD
jgi:hypothetical protein